MSNTTQILIGNATKAPELIRFTSGKVKAVLSIAQDFRDAQGNKSTKFHRISLWGRKAEKAADLITKGAKVLVHGQEAERPYTDKDGNSRVAIEFAAQNFFLLAKPVKAQA